MMSSSSEQDILDRPVRRVRKRAQSLKEEEPQEKKVKFKDVIDLTCHESLDDTSTSAETKSDEGNPEKGNFKRKPLLPPMCHCIECFAYMGETNPRQYCYKRYCFYEDFGEDEILQVKVFHLRSSPYYDDPTFWSYNEYHNAIQEFIDKNYVESVSDSEN